MSRSTRKREEALQEAERTRLLADLERRSTQLRTAAEVSRAASSILDPDELIQQVVDLVRERFDLYYAGLFLVDDEHGAPGEWAILRAGTGEAGRQMVAQGHKLEVGGRSMIGWCVANRQARIALDVGAEAVRFDNPLLPETRSELALPLVSRGQAIGALTIQSTQEAAFSDEDIAVLQTMADQVTTAIANAHLFRERERHITELAILNEVGQAVSSALDLDEVLETVYRQVSRLFDTTNFYIALYYEDTDEWASPLHLEHGEPQPVIRRKVAAGLTGHIIRNSKHLFFHNQDEISAFHEAQGITTIGELAKSWIGVPLIAADRVVGVMAIQSYEQEHLYSEEDLALFSTIADQVATAIANARVFQERAQRIAELAVLNELSQALATTMGMDELLATVHQHVSRLFDTTNFYIATYEESSQEWAAVFDVEHGERQPGARYQVGAGVTSYIISTRQPLLFRTLQEGTTFEQEHDIPPVGLPALSWMGVPLIAADRIVGVMAVQSYDEEGLYDEEDLAVFSTIAARVAAAIENMRLLEESRERAQELEAINETGRAITSVLDLDAVLREIADITKARFDLYYVNIMLREGEEQLVFRSGSTIGDSDVRIDSRQVALDLHGRGLNPTAARTGEPVLVNDVLSDSRYLAIPELPGTRSELVVPIEVKGRVIGTLDVQSNRLNAFDQADVALLQSLASQAGVAIDNARLFQEQTKRATQLALLNETMRKASAILDVDALLREMVASVQQSFDYYHVCVLLMDSEANELVLKAAASGFGLAIPEGYRQVIGTGMMGRAAGTGQSQLANDTSQDPHYIPVGEWAPLSELSVPISLGGRVLGVLDVESDQRNAFSEVDVVTMETLAGQLAVSIENARLFQERERRITEQAIINEIGQAVSAAQELDTFLATVHQQVSRLFDATNFYVAAYLQDTDEWVLPLHLEHGVRQRAVRRKVEVRAGLTSYIIRNREPILFRSMKENNAFHKAHGIEAIGERARSWMGVPLLAADKVVGAMAIQSYEQENVYDEQAVALFSTIADQVAIAFENLRLLEETRQRVQELDCLNSIGRKIDETPPVAEFLQWAAERIPTAMQYPEACVAAIKFNGQVYGTPEAMNLPWQMVQGVRVGGRQVGQVYIAYTEEHDFRDPESALLGDIVRRVSGYVEARRRVEELAVLNELAQALTARLTVEDVLEEAHRGASRLVDTTNFFIALHDEERKEISFALNVTESEIDRRALTTIPADQGFSGYIIRNRTAVLVKEDVTKWLEERGIPAVGDPALSWLGVPLTIGDRVLGVMAAQSYTTPRAYDEHDLDLMTAIASQAAIAIQNARLFEETSAALAEAEALAEEQAVLNELGQALTARLNVEEVLDEAYRQASRLVDTTNFYIGLHDPVKDEVDFVFDVTESEIDRELTTIPAGEGLAGYIVHNRTGMLIEDHVRERQTELGIEVIGQEALSWLGVPLMIGDQVLGVMAVQSFTTPRLYDEHDLDLMTAIASQVAIAVQNARLFEETRTHAEELAVLNELAQALTARLDVDQVLEETFRGVSRLVDTANFYIGLYESAKNEVAISFVVTESEIDRQITVISADQGLTGYIIRNRTSVLIKEDILGWQEERGIEVVGDPALSWLGVPLIIGDQVLGVMAVQSYTTPHAYDEHDRDMLTAIASEAAIAIQNARLFNEAQQVTLQLGERVQELDCLNDIGRKMDETPPVAEFLQWAAGRIPTAMRHPEVCVAAITFNGQVYGTSEAMNLPWQMVQGLRVGGRQVGQVYIAYTEEHEFRDPESALLGDIVRRISGYVETRRLVEETQARARELTVLNEMSRDLTVRLDVDAAVESAYRHTSRLMDTTNFYVALYDAATDQVSFPLAAEEGQRVQWQPRQAGQGLTEYLIRTREPLLIEENIAGRLEDLGIAAIGREAQSWLGVPMLVGDRVLGGIAMQSYTTARLYNEHHRDVLSAIASQVAIAIQNAWLYQAERRRTIQMQALRETAQVITSTLRQEDVFALILEQLQTVIDYDSVALWLREGHQLHVAAARGFPNLDEIMTLTANIADNPLFAELAATRQSLTIDDTLRDERFLALGETGYVRSWIGVPLVMQDEMIGCITIDRRESHGYAPEDGQLAMAFASQAAVAVGNARLFNDELQARTLLDKRVQELDCLNDIGRKVDETPPIPEFLQWVTERIPPAMRYPDVCVAAIEFEGQVYGTPEAVGLPCQIVQGLRIGGRRLGRMCIAYTEEHDFLDEESALLGDVVRRVSGYVESHRLFEETRRRTAELQVLHEIALQLGTELGTAELLRLIVEQAVTLLGAEAGGFYFYDPQSDELVFSVAVGYFAEFTGNKIKPGEGLAGQVFQSRRPLAVEDYGAWAGRSTIYEQEPRLKTVLGVPVLGREGVLGVLDIGGGEKKRAFDEHDIWLAELFAAQSAVALENTRLFEATRARAEREQRVRTITERIRQGRDMESIMRIALEELGWMLGASTSVARLGAREQLLADHEPPAR